MKRLLFAGIAIALLFLSCGDIQKPDKIIQDTLHVAAMPSVNHQLDDLASIQSLVINMLKWADSRNDFNVADEIVKDSICMGFDMNKHSNKLLVLRNTNYFSDEFINNYDRIIRTLDRKIRNKEFAPWNVYELPTFRFANDVSPWCLCQDNLPWDDVIVKPVKLDGQRGQLTWHWRNLKPETDQSWKDFSYTFKVVKVAGEWKIAYLQGFDYDESVKKDGAAE